MTLYKLLGADLLKPVQPGDRGNLVIQRLIFFYAFLWIFEGALRKWFLPGLSDALLIIRDPVVILIYVLAFNKGIFPANAFVLIASALTFIGFGLAMAVGHGNFFVALYGARAMLLHVPLIFVVPLVMDIRHVLVLAKVTLWIVLPMTFLLVLQFLSPPTALINIGLGGVGTAGFSGALGKFRPPGTFSFITGPTVFYPFATACWFLWMIHRQRIGILGMAAGCAILIACPVSISRGLMLGCVIVFIFGVVALFRRGVKGAQLALRLSVVSVIAVMVVSSTAIFREGSAAFADRWKQASVNQGGSNNAILGRFLDTFITPMKVGFDTPLFGYGLGAGTNAGSKLLIGRAVFLAGETEFARLAMENGLLVGWAWIFFRISLTVYIFIQSCKAWKRKNPYPLILFSAIGLVVLQGQWAQPTQLGFACLGGGLVLAACRAIPGQPKEAPVKRMQPRRLKAA